MTHFSKFQIEGRQDATMKSDLLSILYRFLNKITILLVGTLHLSLYIAATDQLYGNGEELS